MSMEFSRQEYWSGLPFPSPGDFPDPGIEPGSPELQADSLPSEPPGKPLTKFLVANSKKSLWFNAAVPGYAPPHLCSSFWLLGCGHAKGRRKAKQTECIFFKTETLPYNKQQRQEAPKRNSKASQIKQEMRTSLVVQWLRIYLPTQGTRV